MITVVAFTAAAAIGAIVRHLLRIGVADLEPIPAGTLVVNLTGSFLLGIVHSWGGPGATVAATAGLGTLTTFSTFSAEVIELRSEGPHWVAAYAATSIVGGVALAWLGLQLG